MKRLNQNVLAVIRAGKLIGKQMARNNILITKLFLVVNTKNFKKDTTVIHSENVSCTKQDDCALIPGQGMRGYMTTNHDNYSSKQIFSLVICLEMNRSSLELCPNNVDLAKEAEFSVWFGNIKILNGFNIFFPSYFMLLWPLKYHLHKKIIPLSDHWNHLSLHTRFFSNT